jgi:teichuronic acid biosynthesis glycosyltransferase TuaG
LTKVSIIIPVYNAEKYLEECLDSALNQTYEDKEIIAVNDGSTDGSTAILQRYSNKIRIISKENGGASSALNEGVKIASGEWLKWLAADDVLYPNAVTDLVAETINLEDKTHTTLYANYDIIDSKGNIIGSRLMPDYNDLDLFNFNVGLLDSPIANQDTVLIHKTTIDKYGAFNTTLRGQEDYELHLRCCLIHHCRLKLVKKTVAKYRIHENQKSWVNYRNPKKTDAIKNSVLSKLDPLERQKYEVALMKHRKNLPFKKKVLRFLGKVIFRIFPSSVTSTVHKMYVRKSI